MEYGVCWDLIITYTEPHFIYLKGSIGFRVQGLGFRVYIGDLLAFRV